MFNSQHWGGGVGSEWAVAITVTRMQNEGDGAEEARAVAGGEREEQRSGQKEWSMQKGKDMTMCHNKQTSSVPSHTCLGSQGPYIHPSIHLFKK